ncbi:hypothetical protein K449DRAFT_388256 [Hypoxylon sp. EC38]|nr:hypothetical protein K449DRAFT_388256 [Hypoxylon sp. EC38]
MKLIAYLGTYLAYMYLCRWIMHIMLCTSNHTGKLNKAYTHEQTQPHVGIQGPSRRTLSMSASTTARIRSLACF